MADHFGTTAGEEFVDGERLELACDVCGELVGSTYYRRKTLSVARIQVVLHYHLRCRPRVAEVMTRRKLINVNR